MTPSVQTNPPTSIARGHSTFYIRMRGHAMRYNYKIPFPYIDSVAGKTAKRVQGRISQKQVNASDEPIYLAKWDILYMIEGGDPYSLDLMSSIVTTGDPAYYG